MSKNISKNKILRVDNVDIIMPRWEYVGKLEVTEDKMMILIPPVHFSSLSFFDQRVCEALIDQMVIGTYYVDFRIVNYRGKDTLDKIRFRHKSVLYLPESKPIMDYDVIKDITVEPVDYLVGLFNSEYFSIPENEAEYYEFRDKIVSTEPVDHLFGTVLTEEQLFVGNFITNYTENYQTVKVRAFFNTWGGDDVWGRNDILLDFGIEWLEQYDNLSIDVATINTEIAKMDFHLHGLETK